MSRTRVAVLGGGQGWHVADLVRAGRLLDLHVETLVFRGARVELGAGQAGVFFDGRDISSFERVIVRSMPAGSLEQVIFRMDALQRIDGHHGRVLNRPRALECAIDKYLSAARLEANGLPVPPTVTSETARDALQGFEDLGGDVVLKPLFGSEGKGVERLRSGEYARARFAELEAAGSVIHIQRFIDHPGHDLRLFVIGGSVIGGMRRHAPPDGSSITNIARGGRAEGFDPPPSLRTLALEAARAVGAEVAGVDVVPDRQGNHWVLEVNAVPGWRALSEVTGIDVAREVLAHAVGEDRGGDAAQAQRIA
jgi:ribosomal protein S6--L-glutamate ligase